VSTNHISGMAEARVTPTGYVKCQHMTEKSPLKGSWSGSCDLF